MTHWNLMLLYIASLAAVYITPGPDMAFIISVSSLHGTAAGISVAAGFGGARFLHVFTSGLGLAALFGRYPFTFNLARILGAAYMFYLAAGFIKNGEAAHAPEKRTPGRKEAFFHGFITNLLNPKALIFCSILLPQFVFSDTLPLFIQFFVLGIILVVTGFAFDAVYAFLSGRLVSELNGKGAATVRQIASPLIFLGLGVYLLVTLFK